MHNIGILYNPFSERSIRLSNEVTAWLTRRGLHIWCGTSEEARDHPAILKKMELLIALGGDGTVLRAARLAVPLSIPILTVAVGSLNFMAELGPNELSNGVDTLLRGEGWFERRALLEASLHRQGKRVGTYTALNEAVVSRGDVSRTLTVDVQIDDIPLTTYRADGVIVATATGSTAYALSAGGPIMDPRSHSMVLVPVAAHLTAVPSIVLHEDTVVRLEVDCYHHAQLSVDGHENVPVEPEDMVLVRRCNQVCIFARVQSPRDLYASFVRRLRRE